MHACDYFRIPIPLSVFIFIFACKVSGILVTYPAPQGAILSNDYTVKAGGQSIAVYRGEGYLPYSFAYFDFSGSAQIEITSVVRSLSAYAVRPESKGIVPSVNGNIMTFTLTSSPCHLSIEPDAKNGPLLLFANPIQQNPPIQGAPGVVYFGPGLHTPNVINLSDNQTLYIAGSAVVQGAVIAQGANIKICGRGILDGFPWPWQQGPTGGTVDPMILCRNCTNMSIEGIIVKDSWRWNIGFYSSSYVNIQNLKIVANRCENEDGIDLLNAQHFTISDCFIRTDDDCIALLVQWTAVPTEDITATRCVLWTDRANIWRLGSGWQGLGVPAPPMNTLLFTDIDVLHYDKNYNPVARLGANKDQPLENVRFENIRINREGQSPLWEVMPSPNTNSPIRNCYFKDIFVTGNSGGTLGNILVSGPDAGTSVSDVTFENFVRHGQITLRTSPGVSVGSNTYNIVFIGSSTPGVQSPYGGTPWPVPGKIEAENYDLGGEGTAYHDATSGNAGGQYRSDGVDIYPNLDTSYVIGFTQAGEWLEYTVTVASSGTYTIAARVSSIDSYGKFHIAMDGADVTGQYVMPAYGGSMVWSTLSKTGISLTAGQHIMKISLDSNGSGNSEVANVNYINIAAGTAITSPVQPALGVLALNAHPNPFNPTSRITVSLPERSPMVLSVYDLTGRLVKTLAAGIGNAGVNNFVWDGSDASGRQVSAGLYEYHLTACNRTLYQKTVYAK